MSVINQWNDIEAKFAAEYGLSMSDMFAMSWRRFQVLFRGVFQWNDQIDDQLAAPSRIGDFVDWDTARHTPVSQLAKSPLDLPGGTVNRLGVPRRG